MTKFQIIQFLSVFFIIFKVKLFVQPPQQTNRDKYIGELGTAVLNVIQYTLSIALTELCISSLAPSANLYPSYKPIPYSDGQQKTKQGRKEVLFCRVEQTLYCLFLIVTSSPTFYSLSSLNYYFPNSLTNNVLFDQAKRGLYFDSNVRHYVCVCHDYGHTPSTILMQHGTSVLGTKTKHRMRRYFHFHPVSNRRHIIWIFFRSYGRRGLLFTELLAINSRDKLSSY